MFRNRKSGLFTLLLGLAVASACTEGPTSPMGELPTTAAFGKGGNGGGSTGPVLLEWKQPLAQDIVRSELCDPLFGCKIKIDELHVNVNVPANALALPTVITVRAMAGQHVNFEFGPHGLQFLKSISVTTGLSQTTGDQVKNGSFSALYWTEEEGFIETLPAQVNTQAGDKVIAFFPDHFSGYALAM